MNEPGTKRSERRRNQRALNEKQKRRGQYYPLVYTLPNRKSNFETVEEEKEYLQQTTEEKLEVYRQLLPGLLKKLSLIPDPRKPEKIKHKMSVMMLYGILMFVLQISSRRESNREITTPQLLENLKAFFPELTEMPHQDSLHRLLQDSAVEQIEVIYTGLLKELIHKKKFKKLLHDKRYLVAIDGTQKYVMEQCWDERYPRRKITEKEGKYHYYAFVVEAVLIFSNGMVLPLMSQFLENSRELEMIEDYEQWKQDCELKAFYRLAERLKTEFPKLPLTLLMDALYAKGPVMKICVKNKWQFMIVLKEKVVPSIWREATGLIGLDKEKENCLTKHWRGAKQTFRWVNNICYEYGHRFPKNRLKVHVVICQEKREVMDEKNNPVFEVTRHAWLSSEPVTKKNVHHLCNLTARKRWLHENNILKEKHQGYHYEHIFSHHFDAMRGYHYLMHIGRMLNEMAFHSVYLVGHVKAVGFQGFINKFKAAMIYRELDQERLCRLAASAGQLRLAGEDDWRTTRPAA